MARCTNNLTAVSALLILSNSIHHLKILVAAYLSAFALLTQLSAAATTFVVTNQCSYTVWPGILSNAGQPLLANGGFTLSPGQSASLAIPDGWSGRLWGRTQCSFDSSGVGTCATGDCGGNLHCAGAGATPPASLVEFTLQGTSGAAQDFYDVSLVDGFNLPVQAVPRGGSGSCGTAGCGADINTDCPSSLQVSNDNQVVACKSACLAFGSAEYCCSGSYANPSTCTPTSYSKIFKAACPNAYSYAYDDPTSTFTCSGPYAYDIVFCADGTTTAVASNSSANASSSSSGGTTTILNSQTWSAIANGAAGQSQRFDPRCILSWIFSFILYILMTIKY